MGDTVTVTLTREQARALLPEVKTQPRTKGVNARTARAKIREALDFPEDQPNCGGSGDVWTKPPAGHIGGPKNWSPCLGCDHPECPVEVDRKANERLQEARAEEIERLRTDFLGWLADRLDEDKTVTFSPEHAGMCRSLANAAAPTKDGE